MTTRKPRRQAPSKELVPVSNAAWDQQVKDVFEIVIKSAQTRGGYKSPDTVRQFVAVDAMKRLEVLVAKRDAELRGTVPLS